MIGIVDPALFLPRPAVQVEHELDLVLEACVRHRVDLVKIDEYWGDLWTSLARPLERQLGPTARRALHELGKRGEACTRRLPALPPDAGRVWRNGFEQLFGARQLPPPWAERMARAIVRAVGAAPEEVVVFTRRIEDRNLVRHAAGYSTLDENTRWVLHVQPRGIGPVQVLCAYHPRNLSERWTARFDWRLPATNDGAKYPFCPPERWWKRSTAACRTVASKPAWIDRLDNAWTRPNIPGGAGYHWDVRIASATVAQRVGLAQLNVVEFGAPESEGRPGQLHHVPSEQVGGPSGTGWGC